MDVYIKKKKKGGNIGHSNNVRAELNLFLI